MKIICQQQELSKALNIVSKAVTSRSTLPVLKGILLQAYPDGRLTLSASDLDISIQNTIPVQVEEPGSIIVIARMFMDIIRKLPGIDIMIETDDAENVMISSMSSKFNIIGMPADEFPVISEIGSDTTSIDIDTATLREMITKTSFAASVDESRGIITGVLLEIGDDRINMAAIDGFRMAITRRTMPAPVNHNFVISAKIINEIAKIIGELSDADSQGTLYLNDKKAVFLFGNIRAELKLLEGNFISYRDILPKENTIEMIADRQMLMDSIERASLFAKAGKNNLVKFDIRDRILTVSSDSEEGKATEDLIVQKNGSDLTIGFNAHFLQDILKCIDDDQIRMMFRSSVDPCMIEPLEGDQYEYLVLPVRIN